jgi:fatty-acyl-CoA synthase
VDASSANEATIWETVADAAGDAPAIVQGERVVSWEEFDDRASRLAAALAAMGVGPGGRVAIALYNSPEYLETVFAAFKLRAAPVNVNYRYQEREISHVLEDSESSAIVFHGAIGQRVRAVAAQLRRGLGLVEIPAGEDLIDGAVEYESLLASHDPAPRITRDGNDEFILYTGGTTGLPSGVVWSHESLFQMQQIGYMGNGVDVPETLGELALTAAMLARSERPPTMLVVSPLMHGTGIFTSMGMFVLGGRVVLTTSRSLDPDEICALIGEHRIRSLSMVGDVFARPIVEALDRAEAEGRPYDLSSLEQVTSVGVTWSAPVKEGLLRHADVVLNDVIAASEASGFAASETRRGVSVETSRFQLGPNARVLDDEDNDVVPGSGTVGVLAVTGPLPKGYLNDPGKTDRTFRVVDGVRYATPGDLATVESDGTVVLLGRGSEVVNTGGEKVFVEEVEQAIALSPSVRDVVVVGVPDARWGHRVTAIIEPVPGSSLTEDDVVELVRGSLADYKRPRQVIFVDRVERSPSGKANRTWAKELAERQSL